MNLIEENPCPFCKSKELTIQVSDIGAMRVVCRDCGALGPVTRIRGSATLEYWVNETISDWNNRGDHTAPAAGPTSEVPDKPALEDCPDCHGEMIVVGNDIMRNVVIECTACKRRHILKGCKKPEDAPTFWKKKLGSGRFDN